MTHRDQRDAERARIESLEEQLAEAEGRVATAEKEARAAREAARALEKRAARAQHERSALEEQNEALRRKGRRVREAEAAASPTPAGWSRQGQQRYFRASLVLTFIAYGGLLPYFAVLPAIDYERSMLIGALASAVGVVVGHGVIGVVTRAPGAYSGALVTLLTSSLSLGGMALLGSGVLTAEVLPEILEKPVRGVGVLAALVAGTYVTASWTSDAAKSPIQPD